MPRTTLLRKQVTPTGSIQPHAGGTAPDGFLVCDGSIVTIADYPKLYAAIGTSWGYGNNDGLTFHLPDLRGRTLRGRDGGVGRDPDAGSRTASNAGGNTGDNVGSVQGDATRNPGFSTDTAGNHNHQHRIVSASGASGTNRIKAHHNAVTNNYTYGSDSGPSGLSGQPMSLAEGNHTHSVTGGNSETRQKNANVNYVIKAV
jgi:microcystin-dependent protein